MKINDKKIEKIRQLLSDEIADATVEDVIIVPTGYREYELESFIISLDADTITELIKQILECEE